MAQGNRGAGGLGTISMIAAFAVIAGFMYWLSITAVPAEPVVAVEEEAPQRLSLPALAANPAAYQDILVELTGVEVVAALAPDAFLIALPDGGSYPVQLHAAIATTAQVGVGAMGSVVGRVQTLPAGTVEAWADSVFVDDAQREAVTASGTYLVAEEVDLGAAEPAADAAADGA